MSMIRPQPMPDFVLKDRSQAVRLKAGRKRINPRGKKTTAWENTRAKLKPRFRAAGITKCEIKIKGVCWRDAHLCFCHTKRRADITSQRELEEVVLGCGACATICNGMPKAKEERLLKKIISKRPIQP